VHRRLQWKRPYAFLKEIAMTLFDNVHSSLSELAYQIRKAQEGIRADTPMWKVQEYMDSLAFTINEMSKGNFDA
jgi:hypothetical protein